MRAPAFWWRPRPGWLAQLLRPFGWIYGRLTLSRMARRGRDAGLPVVCVGNVVAGGAGKTPTTLALLALLAEMGRTPFALSRGYGGRLTGPLRVDPAVHDAGEVGDEPLLLAWGAPTIVARDRIAGAALARALGADVVVMDDGLQNPSLAKTLRLAVVDGTGGVGNGLCLPAGPLRAPLRAQLGQCDAVIVIGPGRPGDAVAQAASEAGLPVLRAGLEPASHSRQALMGRTVVAASGIGRPGKFETTLRESGAQIAVHHAFGDHHPYRAEDVAALLAEIGSSDRILATTAKDWTKLAPLWPQAELTRVVVVAVDLVFEEPAAIGALLTQALAGGSGPSGAAQA